MNDRSGDEFDAWLNRALCEVPTPPGLRARLEQIAAPNDAALDAALRDVPTPPGLLVRLRAIPQQAASHRWRRSSAPTRLALAASLLVCIGGAWFLAALLAAAELHNRYAASPADEPPALVAQVSKLSGLDAIAPENGSSRPDRESAWATTVATLVTVPSVESVVLPVRFPKGARNEALPRVSPGLAAIPGPTLLADPYAAPWLARVAFPLGRVPSAGDTPPLLTEAPPFSPGIELPLNPAENGFLARAGVFPPVIPVGRAETTMGLNFGVGSYDTLRSYVERGTLPSAALLRSEELLAALSRLWVGPPVAPQPKQPSDPPPAVPTFNLTIQGAPSPLGGPDQQLIVVGLRGRELPSVEHRPTHLTVVVDTSTAMAQGGRLALVQRELTALTRQFGVADRLSLVSCGAAVRTLVDELSGREVGAWRQAVAALRVSGTVDLAPCVAAGLSTARAGSASPPVVRRLLFITSGSGTIDESDWQRLRPLIDAARQQGLTWDVLTVSGAEPIAPAWQLLAQAGQGRLLTGVHPAQVQGLLVEAFTRRPQILLSDVRLSVSFPAAQVASYRLLGHEPSVVATVQGSTVDSHLYAGHTTSVAFEIRPKTTLVPPGTPDAELATVTVEWLNRSTGQRVKRSQRLMRSQLWATPGEASSAWQTAALVAATAEVLRGSPFAERVTLGGIAANLRQVSPAQANRPEFQELLSLVEQADAIRQKFTNPRRSKVR